jgi:hypothetical protein
MYHREDFPNMMFLAALCLSAPVHTADCERSFSVQNRLVTPSRSRLTPTHCGQMMTVIVEGPPLKAYDFTPALVAWRKQKQRKLFCSADKSQKTAT